MSVQERTVEEKDEERRKDSKGVWRIFKKGKGTDSTKSTGQQGVTPPPSYISNQSTDNKVEEYEEDSGDISSTHVTGELGKRVEQDEPETPSDLPKTAGFDFKAIGEVLGKNVDPETVDLPQPKTNVPALTVVTKPTQPLERSESAPPLTEEKVERAASPPSSFLRSSADAEQYRPSPLSRSSTGVPDDYTIDAPKPAKQFPSHVLKSAASMFSANPFAQSTSSPVLQDTEVWDTDRVSSPVPEPEDDGDIGYQDRYNASGARNSTYGDGAIRRDESMSSGWATEDLKPKRQKDDWALNNPW